MNRIVHEPTCENIPYFKATVGHIVELNSASCWRDAPRCSVTPSQQGRMQRSPTFNLVSSRDMSLSDVDFEASEKQCH